MEQILSFEANSLVILPNATKLLVPYCTSGVKKYSLQASDGCDTATSRFVSCPTIRLAT